MKGFTLIELLATIGLVLVLALIVYSTFYATSPSIVLRAAVEQVAGDVRLAQDLAISERARYRITFSAGSSSYILGKRDPSTGTWGAATGTQTPSPLPDDVLVQSVADLTDGILIFNSLGAPYEGTGAGVPLSGSGVGGLDHIVLRNSKSGRTGDVTVSPGTGRVDRN
ncbi:MAG: prepilin-type N-terminal cleavage/methylation domain-containing protein [bacterium]